MKIKYVPFLTILGLIFADFAAADWEYSAEGEGKFLYGYADVASKYKSYNKNNRAVSDMWLEFSARNEFSDDYEAAFFADFMGGTDRYLKNYNQGSWGEEIYAKLQTPYGQFSFGQMNNIAYLQGVSAPEFGPLGVNNSMVVDFINNPNWKRRKKITAFKTLNSTYINTDGDAFKISYLTPEYYNTMVGISYVPYSYSRAGLVNKHSAYHNKGGIILSADNHLDFDFAEIKSSLGYAEFIENDKEYSAGLSIYRKGFTLGGSYRRTNANGKKLARARNYDLPEFFDAYRNAEAYNVGLGYEIGPFKAAVTYFTSKAKHTDFEDRIFQLSGEYQIEKHIKIYSAVAHVDFAGKKDEKEQNNKGYAFMAGVGIEF